MAVLCKAKELQYSLKIFLKTDISVGALQRMGADIKVEARLLLLRVFRYFAEQRLKPLI